MSDDDKLTDLRRVRQERRTQEVIDFLKRQLADAEMGKLIALTSVEEYADNTYGTFGTTTPDRSMTAVFMIEAGLRRLGFVQKRELAPGSLREDTP